MALQPVKKLSALIHLLAGTITNALIATNADIAQSKIYNLTTDLSARTVRAADETVSGNWTFGNPLAVAAGVASGDAVNKSQLDSINSTITAGLHPPVQTLVALKAVADGSDKQGILVEDLGVQYRYDAQSTDTPDDNGVVKPDGVTLPSAGRWIKQFVVAVDAMTLSSAQTVTGAKTFSDDITMGSGKTVDGVDISALDTAHSGLQTEVDAVETAVGLNTDGTFTADATTNYLTTATSVKDAAKKLDTQVKAVADRTWRQAFIADATGGETTLYKDSGDPVIPSGAKTQVFIDGRKVFEGANAQYTVAGVPQGQDHITFAPLEAGQSVELLYWA